MSPSLSATSTMQLSFLTRGTGSVWGISQPFGWLFPSQRQVTPVLLTRAPLYYSEEPLVRLACVRRAASVRSEPGSNSQTLHLLTRAATSTHFYACRLFGYSVVKERVTTKLRNVLKRQSNVKGVLTKFLRNNRFRHELSPDRSRKTSFTVRRNGIRPYRQRSGCS